MRVLVVGRGFGGNVVAPIWSRLGVEVDVVSPREPSLVSARINDGYDLVSVHSPPYLHQTYVDMAIDRGRAVLCDKPFGLNGAQARAMLSKAKRAGVLNFLNFEFRCHPARRQLKTLIDAGEIGALEHVSWSFYGSPMRDRPYDWRADSDLGGGWVGAYGSHLIDLLRWLFGKEVEDCESVIHYGRPERRDAEGKWRVSTSEVGFSAAVTMRGGGTASVDTHYGMSVSLPQRITLFGAEGCLEFTDDVEVKLIKPDGTCRIFEFARSDVDPHEPGLSPWLEQVRDAVQEGRQIGPSFEDGVEVSRVMDMLRQRSVPAVSPFDAVPQSRPLNVANG